MAASGQITSGYWATLLIGVLSDVVPSGMSTSLWRCQALIVEVVIVRQRLSKEIDAETYQTRMNELAWQAISERHPAHNV